jgi:carotenoid cleavage dioxygenase-like enzyme
MSNADGYRAGFRTQREELTDVRLSVEGSLPDWLRGTLVGNGPGQFEVGDRDLVHWFDPLAMVRRVEVADDGVWYTNRFVRSRDFAFARKHGKVRTPFPGTSPDRPVWTRLQQTLTGEFPDNPIIGVQRLGDHLLAVTESPWGLVLDPETLETTGRVDLTDGLDCDLTLAHLHHEPATETFLELGVSYGRGATYTLARRPTDGGSPTPLARLRFDDAPYVHSFAVTERYAVVTVPPFGLDTRKLLTGALTGGTFLDAFTALGGPTRFVVLDRETGAHEATVEGPPAFVYHHANAYEDGDDLVVDLVAFPDERAVTGLTLANLRADAPDLPAGDLVRYRLPLDGGDAERRTLHAGPVEFPTIAYRRRNGRPHRYVYLTETMGGSSLPTDLTKVDVRDGTVRRWRDTGTHPGEALFVPAPEPAAEDDGVLLSVVLDPGADRSELVCLDAATLSELARAPLPHRLPYGFHGQFYGETSPGRSVA